MKRQLIDSGLILLAAIIWGTAFVAQNRALQYLQPCTQLALRSWIGAIVLLPFCFLADRSMKHNGGIPKGYRKMLLIAALTSGGTLGLGSIFQTMGIAITSVGKSGFLTALYMLIVPFMAWALGKRPSRLIWLAVAVTLAGMYLLCIKPEEGFSLAIGDIYLIICAVFLAAQIIAIDRYAVSLNGFQVSCAQMLVISVMTTIPALIFEHTSWENLRLGLWPTVYVGVFSNAIAFTLQIAGQKHSPPAVASLLMSTESVFAALFGWLILKERLADRELLGCALVFAAVLIVQVPGFVMMFRANRMKKQGGEIKPS